jgi:hypothetical protein
MPNVERTELDLLSATYTFEYDERRRSDCSVASLVKVDSAPHHHGVPLSARKTRTDVALDAPPSGPRSLVGSSGRVEAQSELVVVVVVVSPLLVTSTLLAASFSSAQLQIPALGVSGRRRRRSSLFIFVFLGHS